MALIITQLKNGFSFLHVAGYNGGIDMCEFKKALEDLDKLSSSLDSDSFVIDVLELCKKLNILV